MAGDVQRVQLTFGPGAGKVIVDSLVEVIERFATVTPVPAADNDNPHAPAVEPWAFFSPSHDGDVVSYLDDRNQIRHVPVKRMTEVPRAWRRLYVEVRDA